LELARNFITKKMIVGISANMGNKFTKDNKK